MVAAVADWLLGAVWFTFFANQWRVGMRKPAQEPQALMSHPNFWPYLIALLCSILMAYVIARLVANWGKFGVFRGLAAGILVGLAAAVAMVTEMVFEVRSSPFILISAGYPLAGCTLMGIIIGIWRPRTALH